MNAFHLASFTILVESLHSLSLGIRSSHSLSLWEVGRVRIESKFKLCFFPGSTRPAPVTCGSLVATRKAASFLPFAFFWADFLVGFVPLAFPLPLGIVIIANLNCLNNLRTQGCYLYNY